MLLVYEYFEIYICTVFRGVTKVEVVVNDLGVVEVDDVYYRLSISGPTHEVSKIIIFTVPDSLTTTGKRNGPPIAQGAEYPQAWFLALYHYLSDFKPFGQKPVLYIYCVGRGVCGGIIEMWELRFHRG